ncbi:MAG: signal peptidase I, partial [Patescibacteria group bacterium]
SDYLSSDVITNPGSFLKEGVEVLVPQDKFIVMGDNRNYSSDSREWGFITKKDLIGKSFFVYWPPDKIGLIKSP